MPELFENQQQRKPGVLGCLGGLLLVPLLFVAAALSIPYGLIATQLYRVRKGRFAKRMAERDRTISFDDLPENIEGEKGTVIREWKSQWHGPTRWWWTDDDVFAKSPFPVTDPFESPYDWNILPFTRWCFDEYINPANGKARLVVATQEQRKLLQAQEDRKLFQEEVKNTRRIDVRTLTKEGW